MTTYGFIGAGNMAGAIVRGAIAAGTDPASLLLTSAHDSAARLAACGGVPVLLASAADISGALSDAHVGTAFHPANGRRLSAWKFWALYAAEVAGTLRIDAGAVTAVTSGGRSLLPIGIQSCEGEFHPGDIVEIMGPDGQIIGRGETNYSHGDLAEMLGRRTSDLPADKRRPVVHADYLSNM